MSDKAFSGYILLYTKDLPDRPEYTAWLLSWPVHLLVSELDFESMLSLLNSFCGEPITLIELNPPYRTDGIYDASEGAWETVMKQLSKTKC